MLANSSVMCPLKPASTIAAVCMIIPSLPSELLPSMLPTMLLGMFTFSCVVASTNSPGCIVNGLSSSMWCSSVYSSDGVLSLGSMCVLPVCLNILNSCPSLKSRLLELTCSLLNGSISSSFPSIFLMSLSHNIIFFHPCCCPLGPRERIISFYYRVYYFLYVDCNFFYTLLAVYYFKRFALVA